jgi:PAS domain S-box-containing protein
MSPWRFVLENDGGVNAPARETKGPSGLWLTVVGLALASAVFMGDLTLPLGFTHPLLYVTVVVLALGHPDPRFSLAAAAGASLLTVIGFFLSPAGGNTDMAIVDRSLAVLVFWTTAGLLLRHKKTHRALLKEQHDAQAYLDIAGVAIVVLDRGGRVALINRKGCELLERGSEGIVGEPWFERFVAELYRAENLATWNRVLAGEITSGHHFENAILSKSGVQRQMAWHRTVMLDADGQVVGTVSSGEDITGRRKSEELLRRQEALAQVGQMAAMVAHQVRNPLAGIKGAIQIIGGRLPRDSPDRQVVGNILTRIDGLNDVTRDLLLFARPRPPRMAPLQIQTVLRDAAALLRTSPEHPGIRVVVTGDDRTVRGDAELLKDAFLNLLLNAAEAMSGAGEIQVQVEVVGDRVQVVVRDPGPGIPADVLDRVFEPFVTTKSRGAGLGLAIVKSQVEAHGGDIVVACPASGGTVMTVLLPIAP